MTTKTTLIAAGSTAADSSVVTIEQGMTAKVSIFADVQGDKPSVVARFRVYEKTPDQDNLLCELGHLNRQVLINGPIQIFVRRSANPGPAFGVFSEV